MKTSLLLSVGALAALCIAAGAAQAQVPAGNPWDSHPRGSAPVSRGYFAPADYGQPAPYAMVSNPSAPVQLESYAGPVPEPAEPYGGSVMGGKGKSAAFAADACGDCVHEVQWQVGADLLYMTRLSGNSYPLLRTWNTSLEQYQPVVASPSDFDFDYEVGYRITASRLVSDGWGIEGSFFALAEKWTYDATYTGLLQFSAAGLTLESLWDPNTVPVTPPCNPLSFRLVNETEFYSADLNVTRGLCDWATFRAGVRYIQLNDKLNVDELIIPVYTFECASTKNSMVGPQAGVDLRLLDWGCRFRLNATINGGVLYNRVEEDPASSLVGPAMTAVANEVALMGEAALTAKVRLTDHIAIRGGYQVIGLHNVALAPDQLITSDFSTNTSYIKMGSLIVHGASLGLEVFW